MVSGHSTWLKIAWSRAAQHITWRKIGIRIFVPYETLIIMKQNESITKKVEKLKMRCVAKVVS